MIRYLYLFFCLQFLFSNECIDIFYNHTINHLNDNILKIDFLTKSYFEDEDISENITLYLNLALEEISIVSKNQTTIMNKDLSKIYYKETNQMYIEDADSSFIKLIVDIFEGDFSDKFLKKTKNSYTLKIESDFNINIVLEDSCLKLNYLEIANKNIRFVVDEIKFNIITYNEINNYLSIPSDYFEFDLR